MKALSKIFLFLALAGSLGAQELPDVEEEQAAAEYAEHLAILRENPINLNHAGLEQLMALPGLTPYQILRLERYLRSHPHISQPYQLETDSVISAAALETILPYICFDARKGADPALMRSYVRLQRRMPQSNELGYDIYPGSPWDGLSRFWLRPVPGGELFLQSQHDPGEPNWADYVSGCLSYQPPGGGWRAVIGDYQVIIGQGLLMGGTSPIIFSSSSYSVSGARAEIKPYRSSQESQGLRGVGFRHPLLGGLNLLTFFSRRKQDARVDSLDRILTLYHDGYHRSLGEISRKGIVREDIIGGRLGWGGGRGPVFGLTYISRLYDKGGGLYNPWLVSIDGGIDLARLRLAGELAHGPGRVAGYGGNMLFVSGGYSGRVLVYGYSPDLRPPRFNSENYYGGEDERGGSVYVAWGWRRLNLAAAYNLFYPWQPLVFSQHNGRGGRYEARVGARLMRGLEADIRVRAQSRELCQNIPEDPYYEEHRMSVRPGLRWEVSRGLGLNCRYDVQYYWDSRQAERTRGELLSAGFRARLKGSLWLAGQSVICHVPDYRSRIYLTEPELLSGGGFHGYWGLGSRDALVIRYERDKKIMAGIKIARQFTEYRAKLTDEVGVGIELEIVLK